MRSQAHDPINSPPDPIKGKADKYQATLFISTSEDAFDKDYDRVIYERGKQTNRGSDREKDRAQSELTKLIATASGDLVLMLGETKFAVRGLNYPGHEMCDKVILGKI